MRSQRVMLVAVAVVVMLNAGTAKVAAQGTAADQSKTLVFATYNGQDRASEVFKTMKSAQGETGERIESYAVVSKDPSGKVHVRDQRKTDAGVGLVVGGVIGLVGGPAGAAVGAATGGAIGYLTGDAAGIPRDVVDNMKQSLTPDSSAIVVVLEDRWVQDVERDMKQAQAREVISNQIKPK